MAMKHISGIQYNTDDNTFSFEHSADSEKNIIDLKDFTLKGSEIFDNLYLYGYEFNNNVPSKIKTEFTKQMKGLSETKIPEDVLERFLVKAIRPLQKQLKNIDVVIAPRSGRTNINQILVKHIRRLSLVEPDDFIAIEMIKNLNAEIEFDYKGYEWDFWDNPKYEQWLKRVKKLMAGINNSNEYFSIAQKVPPVLRPYISNFLIFEEADKVSAKLNNRNILLVDDVNTTYSTLLYMLKSIYKASTPSSIIIFTILGKDYSGIF